MQTENETAKECAKREFFEECGIKIETFFYLKIIFFQENDEKDIGIWIVNAKKN